MKKLLLMAVASLLSWGAMAATWTEPTLPTEPTGFDGEGTYMIKSSEGGYYVSIGTAWYSWATSTVVAEGTDYALHLSIVNEGTEDEPKYSFTNTSTGYGTSTKQIFVSNVTLTSSVTTAPAFTYEYYGEMHSDGSNGSNASRFYEIADATKSGEYYISVYSGDTNYGPANTSYSEYLTGKVWGHPSWDTSNTADPNMYWAVYPFVGKGETGFVTTWQFINLSRYFALKNLYDLLETAQEKYSSVISSQIETAAGVYNSDDATIDEINAAYDALNVAIADNALYGASMDEPVDATDLLTNPDFSLGSISGWTCTFVSGTNATNIGYQSASYTNSSYTYTNHNDEDVNPYVSGFIEAWAAASKLFGSDEDGVTRSLGDAKLSQTLSISTLPAGLYKFSCDAIASIQDDASLTAKGVQLFATAGETDRYKTIATANGVPEHFTLAYVHTGGAMEIGLRTVSCNANWIAADNFELVYYGAVDNAAMATLLLAVSEAEEEYPDLDDVKANAEVIEAYEEALADAQKISETSGLETAEYEAAEEALLAAQSALATSIANYETLAASISAGKELVATISENNDAEVWADFLDEINEYLEDLQSAYDDGEATDDDIEDVESVIKEKFIAYARENATAGDDLTLALTNADFDSNVSGWSYTGTSPVYGGACTTVTTTDGQELEINSGCAERYMTVFTFYQTLTDMPAGAYKMSYNGYGRNDSSAGDDNTAEAYVIASGIEQSKGMINPWEDGASVSTWSASEKTYTDNDGNTIYTPNNMTGFTIYAALGFFENEFTFVNATQGDITLGFRNTTANDWVIWDNVRLTYLGVDFDAYDSVVQSLIDELNEIVDNNALTAEAEDVIYAAVDLGEAAQEGEESEEAYVTAIAALSEALSFANETIDLLAELEETYYDVENAASEAEVDSDYDLDAVMEEIYNKMEDGEFETNAEVEEAIAELKAALVAYIMGSASSASEDEPADVSAIIRNATYGEGSSSDSTSSSDYWETNGTISASYGVCEIYNQLTGAKCYQVLPNLSKGYYLLKVDGFNRTSGSTITAIYRDSTELNDTLESCAKMYAGDTMTKIYSIIDYAEGYSDSQSATTDSTWAVPTSMYTAALAFEADCYKENVLQFEVEADGTDVEIGIVLYYYRPLNWTIWDNWQLFYLGTEAPSTDQTTLIETINAKAAGQTIYNVAGVQQSKLQSGVNIIKSADGTVQKVLVK